MIGTDTVVRPPLRETNAAEKSVPSLPDEDRRLNRVRQSQFGANVAIDGEIRSSARLPMMEFA